MAAPHVAGLAGLLLSKNPTLTQEEIKTIIRSTTDNIKSEKYIGTGRINAFKAIQRDSSPIVDLNYTLDDAIVYNEVIVKGTACGSTFLNYGLYYGLGVYPDDWDEINSIEDLEQKQRLLGRPLKVATKFPHLTEEFFSSKTSILIQVIQAEGALEIAPTVGYADLIVDLVSTGTTLRDNRLKRLPEGKLLDAEACLIANKQRLKESQETLAIATQLLELVGAHLRGKQNLAIFARSCHKKCSFSDGFSTASAHYSLEPVRAAPHRLLHQSKAHRKRKKTA